MMKALTEFLAAGLKREQPKATLQGGDSGTQPFAETMDVLMASTTGGSQKLTSINELTDSSLDGIKVSADSQLPSQVIVTIDLIDSQGVLASTVIGDGSLDSPIGVAATYVETSAGAEESAELTMAASSTSVPTTPVQSELPNKAMSAAIPTEITLNMVEAGRKFAGHLSETPSNRPSVDPRLEVATDRAAVASSAAVVRTELTARQPVSFDTGIKLSNTEPQQFAGDMATHVRVLKSQSGGEVKLNLHPAELGRMSISVSTEGNETRVAFVVETSQARQAVETALPRLRDMLENAGLSLSDSDVSEQRDSQAGANERGSGGSRGETATTDSDDISTTTVISVKVDPDRLIDTYI